jgi:hypothetical protein
MGSHPAQPRREGDETEAAARVVLELAQGEVEHAFAVSDRLEGKARSLMTIGDGHPVDDEQDGAEHPPPRTRPL